MTGAPIPEGADAVMNLIDSPGVENGGYYSGLRAARPHEQARDAEARRRLRELSERLVDTAGG